MTESISFNWLRICHDSQPLTLIGPRGMEKEKRKWNEMHLIPHLQRSVLSSTQDHLHQPVPHQPLSSLCLPSLKNHWLLLNCPTNLKIVGHNQNRTATVFLLSFSTIISPTRRSSLVTPCQSLPISESSLVITALKVTSTVP